MTTFLNLQLRSNFIFAEKFLFLEYESKHINTQRELYDANFIILSHRGIYFSS